MSKAKTFEARKADGSALVVARLGEFTQYIDKVAFKLLVTREKGCNVAVTEPTTGLKLAETTAHDYVAAAGIGGRDHIAAAKHALARRIKGKEDVARTLIESKIREFSGD